MLSLLNVVLSAMTGAVAIVLAFLFYLGLRYSKKNEGQHIMRAIIWVWIAVATHQLFGLFFNIRIASGEITVSSAHYWANIPVNIFLMLACMYYLWATVRRNPPINGETVGRVRGALDEKKSHSR